jgi:short-subunit dehydrogenase
MKNKVVLVTGASSGIGKEIAELLLDNDYTVYGTSRKSFFDETVKSNQVIMVPMDVESESSIKNVVEFISKRETGVDILINCAGSGIAGSIEGVPIHKCIDQFNVNFFGVVRVIQQVLPMMRTKKSGHIINIGSVAGYIPIPFQSMYSASKFALESLSETLRMELKKFNIKVSIVEPGDTKTNFTASRQLAGSEHIESFYIPECESAVRQMEKDEKNGYSPRKVAKTVLKVAKRKNPPVRVTVGFSYKLIYLLSKILPTRLKLLVLKWIY